MSVDAIQHFAAGVWSLRYVLLFVAFLTATAFALEYRRKWHDAAGLVKVYVDELARADKRGERLMGWLVAATTPGETRATFADATRGDDPAFSEGYVYDRIPAWVPADVPGSPQEPRRVPR